MKNDAAKYKKIGTISKTTYTKKSLKSGQKYYSRVRAYKTLGGKDIYSDYKIYSVKVKLRTKTHLKFGVSFCNMKL